MALLATNRFAGDGATTSYEFNFVGKYIARSHVKVYQEDDATKVRTPVAITDSNFLNDTTLRSLPVTPVGKTLVIYRETPKPPMVDFTNGARFTEYNMDLVARQGLFVAMEAMDAGGAEARQQLIDAIVVATSARDAAVIAKNSAEAALDSFDDRYLGEKAVGPTTDNDGGSLIIGALYWDTSLPGMRSWNGSDWVTLPAATAAAVSNTPAGSIAATTVQGAINELATERYGRDNILGGVSQSAGVPTGAVIERGSNANGLYVRFADGTQICTQSSTFAQADEVVWTFPATFASDPNYLSASANHAPAPRLYTADAAINGGNIYATIYRSLRETRAPVIDGFAICVIAVGRWF